MAACLAAIVFSLSITQVPEKLRPCAFNDTIPTVTATAVMPRHMLRMLLVLPSPSNNPEEHESLRGPTYVGRGFSRARIYLGLSTRRTRKERR
jgi:hypothetical protein